MADRIRSLAAEVADLQAEVRAAGEGIEEDPERLAALRERRQLLADLRRKYGTATLTGESTGRSGTLADVLAYQTEVAERLVELDTHDERARALDADRSRALDAIAAAAATVAAARRKAASPLAEAVQDHLRELAMAKARVEVTVDGPDPADDVRILLAANPGAPPLPLAKVASGGELARTMLALRLVLRAAPPVLVFDEVDAGVGGASALAVGRALAALGADHQVLVVTHLPQVAAYADTQVTVTKVDRGGVTVADATTLTGDGPSRGAVTDAVGDPAEHTRARGGQRAADARRHRTAAMMSSPGRSRSSDRLCWPAPQQGLPLHEGLFQLLLRIGEGDDRPARTMVTMPGRMTAVRMTMFRRHTPLWLKNPIAPE